MTAAADARPEIHDFFRAFSAANENPSGQSAELFCDQFLTLNPTSASVATREQLAAALPHRARLFASIGAQGSDLTALTEHPIDAIHTLASTTWQVRLADPGDQALTLESTYLLRHTADGWRIAAYINPVDIVGVIAERSHRRRRP